MKNYRACFALLLCIFSTFCQEFEADTDEPIENDGIIFSCAILKPEAKSPDFSVSGDTIFFTVYYIDFECERYVYEFTKKKNVLAVRRVPMSGTFCDKKSDVLYGFAGSFSRVTPGKYQFQLESEYDGAVSVIFRDVVSVK